MRAIASSFLRFLDHTQWCTTVGRTPLDDWSARRRDLYLTPNTHNRQTSMPPVGFEPTISAGERPQTARSLGPALSVLGHPNVHVLLSPRFTSLQNKIVSHGNKTIWSVFSVVGENVAVNNIKVCSVFMDLQQWTPFALLSIYEVFRTAVSNRMY